MIKNLIPGLPERGKIKIGRKGKLVKSKNGTEFRMPEKLDHFIITGVDRGEDDNFNIDNEIENIIGKDTKQIPIRLIFDDIEMNFSTRYAKYDGKKLIATSDGETCQYLDKNGVWQEAPWPKNFDFNNQTDKNKWKINATLSVMIDGAQKVGGVWKFRTTSYNSTVGILSSLTLIKRLSGGVLAGLPLMLSLQPKTVTVPGSGKSMTAYIAIVEYNGNVDMLRKAGYALSLSASKHGLQMDNIEQEAKKLLAVDSTDFGVDEDVIPEYYPEEVDVKKTGSVGHTELNPEPKETEVDPAVDVETEVIPKNKPVKKRKTAKKTTPQNKPEEATTSQDVSNETTEQAKQGPDVQPSSEPESEEPLDLFN